MDGASAIKLISKEREDEWEQSGKCSKSRRGYGLSPDKMATAVQFADKNIVANFAGQVTVPGPGSKSVVPLK